MTKDWSSNRLGVIDDYTQCDARIHKLDGIGLDADSVKI